MTVSSVALMFGTPLAVCGFAWLMVYFHSRWPRPEPTPPVARSGAVAANPGKPKKIEYISGRASRPAAATKR